MKKWTVTLVIVLIVGAASAWFIIRATSPDDEAVNTTSPEFRDIRNKAVVTGSIEPNQEVEVKSSVSGVVDALYVSVGDRVERGQRIARIQIIPDPEQINDAERGVRIARLNYQKAKENFERQQELYEGEVISKAEFEEVENEYEIRKEELNAAKNRLEILRQGATQEMEETSNIITATMDGVVMSIPVREGSSITGRGTFNEGTPVMIIADMDQMVFQGNVGESEVARLETGMEMELTVGALPGIHYNAMLGFISPQGQEDEGMVQYSISAAVEPREDNILRAGYSASAEIIIEAKDSVLSVEERHLQFERDEPYLMIEKAPGQFEKQFVGTGISDGIYIEITDGLEPNDKFKTRDAPGTQARRQSR